MEPKAVMKKSIKHVIDDLDRIGTIVRKAERHMEELRQCSPEKERLFEMNEELEEVHARLEGVKEFILSCQRRVMADNSQQEELDVWL